MGRRRFVLQRRQTLSMRECEGSYQSSIEESSTEASESSFAPYLALGISSTKRKKKKNYLRLYLPNRGHPRRNCMR